MKDKKGMKNTFLQAKRNIQHIKEVKHEAVVGF